jgi:hypothetical protein
MMSSNMTPLTMRGNNTGKKRHNSRRKAPASGAKRLRVTDLAQDKKARASPIFRIPNELLEVIFLDSMGTQLAVASPVLGMRLSSGVTRMAAVARAFELSWQTLYRFVNADGSPIARTPAEWSMAETYQVCTFHHHSSAPPLVDGLVQTQLSRYRWFDIEMVLRAEDHWFKTSGYGTLYKAEPTHALPRGEEPQLYDLNGYIHLKPRIEYGYELPSSLSSSRASHPEPSDTGRSFSSRRVFNFQLDYHGFYCDGEKTAALMAHMMGLFRAPGGQEGVDRFPPLIGFPSRDILAPIPRRLLADPWNDVDHTRLLFWFFLGGAFFHPSTIDWKVPTAPMYGHLSNHEQELKLLKKDLPLSFINALLEHHSLTHHEPHS